MRTADPDMTGQLPDRAFASQSDRRSSISKRWTVSAAYPVFGLDDKLAGAVAMGIDLENWVSFPIAGEPKGTIHDVRTGMAW